MRSIIIFLHIIFIGALISHPSFGQCNTSLYTEMSIKSMPEDFTFLKTFKIDGKNGANEKVEYSYVFSKDTKYSLNISTEGEEIDGIVVSMYDSNRKQVATNNVKGTLYSGIEYPCKSTGIYYITFTFEDSKTYCGGSALGFKR